MAKLRMTFQVNRICPGAFDTAYSILYDNLFQVELADKAAAGLAKKKKGHSYCTLTMGSERSMNSTISFA
jgi:hypothetical protein